MELIVPSLLFLLVIGILITAGCWLMLKLLVWILFLPIRILFGIVLAPLWLAGIFLKLLLVGVLLPLAIVGIFIAILVGLATLFVPLALVLLLVGVVWPIAKAAGATTAVALR